jgi:hypothetical protein
MSRFFGAGGACGGKDGAGGWSEWPVHMKCSAVEDRARRRWVMAWHEDEGTLLGGGWLEARSSSVVLGTVAVASGAERRRCSRVTK